MANLTRILNNQIYSKTIIASQKIADGTITGSLFSSNVTVPGDFLITGNLFVLGTSAYTTIASTNTYVNDPLVVLNNGFAGTNTYDEGFIFNRGSLQNRALIWSEYFQEFRLIGTTETGTAYGNVAVSSYANLHIGNLTVDYTITHNGNFFTSGFINTSGNISAAVGLFGAINSTGFINTTGNISASQASVGTLNATGLINTLGNISASEGSFATVKATGLINTTGNISAATVNAATVNASGNVLATVFNGGAVNVSGNVVASTLLATLVQATNGTFGNVASGFIGNTGTAFTGASLNVTGNVLASTVGASYLTASTATVGNISAVTIGNTGAYLTGGTLNISGNTLLGLTQAAAINNSPIGNATPSTGVFTTVTAGQVSSGFIGNTGTAFTGASLNVTGNVLASTINLTTLNATTVTATGNVIGGLAQFAAINSTPIGNATASTGAFTTLTATSVNSSGNILGAAATFNSSQINGNETITGYLNVAGNILGSAGTLTTLNLNSTTNATEGTGSSGALQIKGGGSFAKDVWIGGNLYVSNIYATSYNVLTVNDPLLYLTAANTFPYNYEIGFYSQFTGGPGNIYQHSGVVRDHVDGYWKAFSNVVAEPTGTITFDADTKYDGIKAGNLILTDSTASTTTTTGALKVAGGVGVVGAVTAGSFNTAGNVVAGTVLAQLLTADDLTVGNVASGFIGNTGTAFTGASINLSGNVLASTSIAQLHTGTNATFGNVASGFIGNTGTAFTGASINLSGNVLATGGIFNALTVNGNETITGYLNVAGNVLATRFDSTVVAATGIIWANSTTASTNTTTGALVLAGGLGLAGNIFQGGAYLDTSSSNYIIGGTPTTVDAFKAATTLNIGATSGTATIQNPTLVGTQATQALYNTVASTINFGRAANITMGHTDGTTTLQGNANIRAVTQSTSFTNGALVIAGGVGVASNVNIKGTNYLTLGKDIAGGVVYPENSVQITANANASARISIQNISTSQAALSEFIAVADNGSNVSNYIVTGVTGTTFNSAVYGPIVRPNDGYTVATGNLVLSAFTDVVLASGGVGSVGVRISKDNSNVGIQYSTESTSATTGALTTVGGVGIGKDLNVGKGAIFNTTNSSNPFKVNSSVSGNVVIFGNISTTYGATSEYVVIGGGNLQVQPGVTLKVGSASTMMIPVGPTGARPSSLFGNVSFDKPGMLRFNSTINNMEFYDGTTWQVTGTTFTVITDRQFQGNTAGGYGNVDGTNTVFTLQSSATTSATIVSINGVMQFPTLAYSVSGDQLTFTEPPAPGDVIDARILVTTTTVASISNGNGANQFLADDNGLELYSGPSGGSVNRINIDTGGNINVLAGSKITYNQTAISIPNTNLTLLDSFSANSYTTAKYVISMKQDTGNVQAMEALLTQSTVGSTAGTAYITTYGIVNTGNTMGTLAANVDVSGSWTVKMYLIPNNQTAISNVKVMTTYIV